MMSKHKDPKALMRYDYGRENLDQNAVKFLQYEEELVIPTVNISLRSNPLTCNQK